MYATNKARVDDYMPNKKLQHSFLLRRGFYLPSFKSSFCTVEAMHRVFLGEVWIPQQSEIASIILPTPPPNELLKGELMAALADRGKKEPSVKNLFDELIKKDVDKPWMLKVLHHIQPSHPFFKPSYMPPKKPRKLEKVVDDGVFEAYARAFEDIPIPSARQRGK